MKVELSLAQLNKLTRLGPESWKALLSLIQQGGSGDFSTDLAPLRELGLVQKVGPMAYVKFPIDGVMPQKLPTVARRRSANEIAAFMSVWRKRISGYLTGADMSAIKRFSYNYSIDEFKELVDSYVTASPGSNKTLANMWTCRNKFRVTGVDEVFGDDDEDS